ncbi:DUF2336 domain-containing protein [Stakelama saccharophila]|uniref:DUF2336 domain-containing protein n=1 Tax=Stakelama saccharophila TaxID=3075605 RepID=A0ABZ0B5C9_9SPHN|nr:DUF2336 domain-containing protein [Stakelama sp. W311]WNO52595.1 DUF2336 domain-containing protein [Stakelama sp. W311]
MPGSNVDHLSGNGPDVASLSCSIAGGDWRIRDARASALAELAVSDAHRLDEQLRISMVGRLNAMIDAVARALRGRAVQELKDCSHPALAARLEDARDVAADVADPRFFMRSGLADELYAQQGLTLLARSLPISAGEDPQRPSLLVRLTEDHDRDIAAAARAMLIAESGDLESDGSVSDLPDHLQHRFVWQVAAALRLSVSPVDAVETTALDRAIEGAANACLTEYDDQVRAEAAAMSLAERFDGEKAGRTDLLLEALEDRRPRLFVALLACGLRMEFPAMRDIVVDRDGALCWMALRALGLERPEIARVGYPLAEAKGDRFVQDLADSLETIAAMESAAALDALSLHRAGSAYREAVQSVATLRKR